MNILAIGNSFSRDATRYLHQIAQADDVDLTVVNLYIGGCPLRKHYNNALEDKAAYEMDFNGEPTGFYVGIKEALLTREWDWVTIQQVSQDAPVYETYQPYLKYMTNYIKTYAPKAKLAFHQTWAYEKDSKRLCEELGYDIPEQMLEDIQKSVRRASESMGGAMVIPGGAAMMNLWKSGVEQVHRDTFHASLGCGRYVLALTWYLALTGHDVEQNTFRGFDVPVSEAEVQLAKAAAIRAVEYGR